jgi:hypothetical protein
MGRQLQANLSSPTVAAQRSWADRSPVLQFRRQRNVCFGRDLPLADMECHDLGGNGDPEHLEEIAI